jgi:hypothetical protein
VKNNGCGCYILIITFRLSTVSFSLYSRIQTLSVAANSLAHLKKHQEPFLKEVIVLLKFLLSSKVTVLESILSRKMA